MLKYYSEREIKFSANKVSGRGLRIQRDKSNRKKEILFLREKNSNYKSIGRGWE